MQCHVFECHNLFVQRREHYEWGKGTVGMWILVLWGHLTRHGHAMNCHTWRTNMSLVECEENFPILWNILKPMPRKKWGATISTTHNGATILQSNSLLNSSDDLIHIRQLSCAQGVFMGTFGMPKHCRRGYQWQEYIFRALQEEAEVRVWALSEIGQLNTTDTHLEYEDTLACLIVVSWFDPCQRSRQLAQIVHSCSLFYIP